MEFTVAERLHLVRVLPAEGNAATLRIVRDFRADLSFSEKEYADYQIRSEVNASGLEMIRWDPVAAQPKDVEITPVRLTMVKDALKSLDSAKKLTTELLPIYERFDGMKVEEKVAQ